MRPCLVYGFLALGFSLMVLRYVRPQMAFSEGLMRTAFWCLNGGLVLMIATSLLPIGILQFHASVSEGLWWARSEAFMQQPLLETLRWVLNLGDVVFIVGALAMAWQVVKGVLGQSAPAPRHPGLPPRHPCQITTQQRAPCWISRCTPQGSFMRIDKLKRRAHRHPAPRSRTAHAHPSGVADNAQAIAEGIVGMSAVIEGALAVEDQALYPSLQRGGDADLGPPGPQVPAEMAPLARALTRVCAPLEYSAAPTAKMPKVFGPMPTTYCAACTNACSAKTWSFTRALKRRRSWRNSAAPSPTP